MALPTTDRYPFQLVATVPIETAIELYAQATARELTKADMVRAAIDAGLSALSPSYRRKQHAEAS